MGSPSGGCGPAHRANEANGCQEAELPLSRGGRGERTVVVRSVGRAAAGRPRGCRGTPGAAERLQGWGGPDALRSPGAAGSRPGPARGGRTTPGELPGGEFAPQLKEGGCRRGPSKPPGNPSWESPGSCCFLGRLPGRPRRRVTVLGPQQKAPPGDPQRGPASRGSPPRGLQPAGRSFAETRGRRPKELDRGGAEPGLPGAGQGSAWTGDGLWDPWLRGPQRPVPRGARPRSGLAGALPRRGRPGAGR